MEGFLILAGYGLLLGLIVWALKRKRKIDACCINSMIFAGEKAKSGTLVFSVFSAWMWTTSILGASETYFLYGIWGPVAYVIGACVSFAVFVFFLCSLRQRMPEAVTYLDFLEQQYGSKTKLFFYMFAFVISAYVLIEQAVGIAYVMETFFGSSFKWTAFCSVMLAVAFVCLGGMKSLLSGEKITSFVIFAGFLFFILFFIRSAGSFQAENWSLDSKALTERGLTAPALRYFVMAIVIGFSQLAFDPAYYVKAKMARDTKQLKRTYLAGGIALWGSISLVSSIFLGSASSGKETEIMNMFTGCSMVIFAIVMTFIGIGTVAHYLIGMLGIFTTDYYGAVLRPKATERQKLVFGRVMTISIGVFCALIAISLEDISLLTIDVFCAIFFAAPCGPLVMGFFAKRPLGNVAVPATSLGIVSGIIVWVLLPAHGQWDQFVGMGVSFGVPLLIMLAGKLFGRNKDE